MSFNEEGINSSGSLTKSLRQPPQLSAARERAQAQILTEAKSRKQPVGVIISKIFSQSVPELQSFVQARGETPSTDLRKLALQAALLRATEIGTAAKMLDTDDNDALYKLEESEEQAVDDNEVTSSSILSPDTAAALTLLVERISQRHKANGRTGDLKDFVVDVKNASGVSNFDDVNCGQYVNNADGDEYLQEYEDNYGPVDSGGNSFWDNLFGNIDKVVDGITKVTGAVNTTVGNVQNTYGGILGQATDIGGTIGAKSIQQYLAANWLKVVVVIAIFIIFTILLVRATSRK